MLFRISSRLRASSFYFILLLFFYNLFIVVIFFFIIRNTNTLIYLSDKIKLWGIVVELQNYF